MVQTLIGEAFIAVRADTTAFSAQVASAAQAAAGTAGTNASKSFTQKFATGATAFGKTMSRSVTLPLVGIGIAAGVTAANFESAFSKMSGLVGVSDKELAKFRTSVMDLSGETAIAPQELAESLYFITSAGQSGATALETLRISARAAAAGLGETQVVADTITSAMAAYGPEVLSAARATDILVAGVKFGKAEADELAGGIGNLAPLASQLGVSFEDLTATISAMTVVGIDTDTAFTNVSAILSGLLKTAPQSERALELVGLSSAGLRDTIAKPGGLVQALREIDTAFGGNEEAMAQVFPNIRALRGVMGLLAQNGTEVDRVFRGVRDSTGSLDHAFDAASKTSEFKFKQALADLQTAGIQLGDKLIPIGLKIANFATGIVDGFSGLPEATQNMILLGGGALAAVGPISRLVGAGASIVDQFTRSTSGLQTFGNFLGGGTFAGNAVKGGLALSGFMLAAELIGPKLTEMTGSAEIAGGALGALAGLSFGPWGAVIGGVLGAVAGHFGLLGDDAAAAADKAKAAIDALTDSMLRQSALVDETSARDLAKDWREFGDTATRALPALESMNVTFEDLNRQLAGGPVDMDRWVTSQVDAALAAGATDDSATALAATLTEIGPKWVAANEQAMQFAQTANDASFFTNQFDSNLANLNLGLGAATMHFAATGTMTEATRIAFGNAGLAVRHTGQELIDTGASAQQVTDVLGVQIGALVGVQTQMGMTDQQAIQYTASLLGIPPDVASSVTNTADLARLAAELYRTGALDPLRNTWTSTVTADTGQAMGALGALQARLNEVTGRRYTTFIDAVFNPPAGAPPIFGFQRGGGVPGPESRAVPAILHGGEHVLNADVVDQIKRGTPSHGAPAASDPLAAPGSLIPKSVGLSGTVALEAAIRELTKEVRRSRTPDNPGPVRNTSPFLLGR